jgi:hypothetical protein
VGDETFEKKTILTMDIQWTQKSNKSISSWHFGKTNSRFRIEVGPNTDKKFSWLIFHDDFKHVVYGDSEKTVEKAKEQAVSWLKNMTILGDKN